MEEVGSPFYRIQVHLQDEGSELEFLEGRGPLGHWSHLGAMYGEKLLIGNIGQRTICGPWFTESPNIPQWELQL